MALKYEGRLDIITGPMFSGKSEELVKRLRRFKVAGLPVKVFNHAIDDRYGKKIISSHAKDHWRAIPVSKPDQIPDHITSRTKVVVIDEAQFFDDSLVTIIESLINRHIIIIAAGLDTNFRGEPFGCMPQLLALADGEVLKLKAVCSICKKWNATRTQRLYANGAPASYNEPLVKVGASDSYVARCRRHHEVPGKPHM